MQCVCVSVYEFVVCVCVHYFFSFSICTKHCKVLKEININNNQFLVLSICSKPLQQQQDKAASKWISFNGCHYNNNHNTCNNYQHSEQQHQQQ